MLRLKHRRLLFLLLLAVLAGGSMAAYSQVDAGFLSKTVVLITFQQLAAIAIYLLCFGWDLPRTR